MHSYLQGSGCSMSLVKHIINSWKHTNTSSLRDSGYFRIFKVVCEEFSLHVMCMALSDALHFFCFDCFVFNLLVCCPAWKVWLWGLLLLSGNLQTSTHISAVSEPEHEYTCEASDCTLQVKKWGRIGIKEDTATLETRYTSDRNSQQYQQSERVWGLRSCLSARDSADTAGSDRLSKLSLQTI